MQKRYIRIMSAMLIIMPFIYIPNIYKEILVAILGVILLLSTINTKKKVV